MKLKAQEVLSLTIDEALEKGFAQSENGELSPDAYESILEKLGESEKEIFTMGLANKKIVVRSKMDYQSAIKNLKLYFLALAKKQGCIFENDYHNACYNITDSRVIGAINNFLVGNNVQLKKNPVKRPPRTTRPNADVTPQYRKEVENAVKHPNINKLHAMLKRHAMPSVYQEFSLLYKEIDDMIFSHPQISLEEKQDLLRELNQILSLAELQALKLEIERDYRMPYVGNKLRGSLKRTAEAWDSDPSKSMPKVKKDMPQNKLNEVIDTLRDSEDEFLPSWKKFDLKKIAQEIDPDQWMGEIFEDVTKEEGNLVFHAKTRGGRYEIKVFLRGDGYYDIREYTRGQESGAGMNIREDDILSEIRGRIENAAEYDGINYQIVLDKIGVLTASKNKTAQRIDEEKRRLEDAIVAWNFPGSQEWVTAVQQSTEFPQLTEIWEMLWGTKESVQQQKQIPYQEYVEFEETQGAPIELAKVSAADVLKKTSQLGDLGSGPMENPAWVKFTNALKTYQDKWVRDVNAWAAMGEELERRKQDEQKDLSEVKRLHQEYLEGEGKISAAETLKESKDEDEKSERSEKEQSQRKLSLPGDPVEEHIQSEAKKAFDETNKRAKLKINDKEFTAHIAESNEQKSAGLEVFSSLDKHEGMLFPFEASQHVTFHMWSVKFPIDIIFLMESPFGFEATKIIHNIQPGNGSKWACNNTIAVVELPGGTCKKEKIQLGTVVEIGE